MHGARGLVVAYLGLAWYAHAFAGYNACAPYRQAITREANLQFGMHAPIPAITGMFFQESQCNPNATNKADGGAGFGQLTGTANIKWIAEQSGIKNLNPYNLNDNIRGSLWLLKYNYDRIPGSVHCEKLGAAFSAYNGGLSYVLASYTSSMSTTWFFSTELIKGAGRQSPENFAYARSYPRKIIFKHQPNFATYGELICKDYKDYGK